MRYQEVCSDDVVTEKDTDDTDWGEAHARLRVHSVLEAEATQTWSIYHSAL